MADRTKSVKPISLEDFEIELELYKQGYKYICGVDEVGRGPLVGPVTVCAAIMDLEKLVSGVTDSKKLSEKKREALFPKILENAICYNVAEADNKVIDEINILNATKNCMLKAVAGLSVKPDFVLVDAVKLDFGIPSRAIIHGDALSYNIGAASIIAKVTRDRYMEELDAIYPQYGFKKNKGYGTKEHVEAIIEHGVTPLHRPLYVKSAVASYEQKNNR